MIESKKIERLELIAIKLEKIKGHSLIIEDLRWLVKELREAWLREK